MLTEISMLELVYGACCEVLMLLSLSLWNIGHILMVPPNMFLHNALVVRDVGAVWALLTWSLPTLQPQMPG